MSAEPLSLDPSLWRLSLIALHPGRIVIHLSPVRPAVSCPDCSSKSTRIHSRYDRHPRDVPWALWPIQLVVHSRKFFCDNHQCLRRIFTEPFPGVLGRYARQTNRLQLTLLELAHLSNAEAAARVGKCLGYITSPDTLIRLQRKEHFNLGEPRVLGVDEFSLKRGQTYGTILVDLEKHRPIDILEGKEAEPLTTWLKTRPGVSVIARDRSGAYALAGRTGAPQALQVADRFHLVHNVNDALRELFRSSRWHPPEEKDDSGDGSLTVSTPPEPLPDIQSPRPSPAKEALWEVVQELHSSGQPKRTIAKDLGIHRKTVDKYINARSPPVYRRGLPHPTKLTPYLDYLMQRWREGCTNARALHSDLAERGYNGGYTQLKELVRPWRSRQPAQSIARPKDSLNQWLVLRPQDHLSSAEEQQLDLFLQANPRLALGYQLKEEFQRIVAQREIGSLDAWLKKAAESNLKPFQSLTKGFLGDLVAIRSALTLPWSTAQCEGQNCRIKLIKRLGYGRARLDLLRQRVLHRTVA